MAEMAAIRMFMKLRAFDKLPLEGSISYKDLAASLEAEEPLISLFAHCHLRGTSCLTIYQLGLRG